MSASETPASLSDLLVVAGLDKLGVDPAPDAVEHALRSLAGLLKGADALRVATAREAAIQELKQAGISSPAALWDAAIGSPKTAPDDAKQGRTLTLEAPEPWSHKVDGAELLKDLSATFEKFVSLPKGAATALALWVVHAHAHDASFVSPILAITSPEKRCGKTTTLALVGALVPKSLPTSNISTASLFRAVEKYRPTLLVDEADSFLTGRNASDELRGILNSGHTKSLAVVVRCSGDDFEARTFSTWAPKSVALIGKLPSTLEDRSVSVPLQRQPPGEKRTRLRLDKLDELEHLRRKAARWSDDHKDKLRTADPEVPDQLHDRAQDNWRPLLAIADAAGGTWPERARTAAIVLSGAADDGDSAGPMLLSDLRDLFEQKKADALPSAEILAALAGMDERPWPEWRQGKPITAAGLARLLKPFGVRPKQTRFDELSVKGYERKTFKDAFARYLPPRESKQPKQSSDTNDNPAFPERNNHAPVSDTEDAEKPHGALFVSGVSGEKGVAEPEMVFVPDDELQPKGESWRNSL